MIGPFKKKKTTKPQTEADYMELAKQLVIISEVTNPNRFMVYRRSFMKGVVSGLGGVIGATVVLGLLLWVLHFFNELPFVGDYVKSFNSAVDTQ